MKKFIVLDRDGIINEDSVHYIKSPDEFIFLPKSIDALVRLTQAGYQIAIATNQSGIARGFYDEDTLSKIHKKLIDAVEGAGAAIAAIAYCPHHPNDGCRCRKPNPGLLYMLAKRLRFGLKDVPFVGDRFSDIQAAVAAGARPILVRSSMTEPFLLAPDSMVPVFGSLYEVVTYLLDHESQVNEEAS